MSVSVIKSHLRQEINVEPGVNGAYIAGIGWALPSWIVTNEMVKGFMRVPQEVEEREPTTTQWMEDHMGIKGRRFLSPGETMIDFATIASKRALAAANISPEKIDKIIVATVTPESHWPTDSALVAKRLGINVAGEDDTSACSSFVNTLHNGYALIRAGLAKRVLVLGHDAMSSAANPFDRTTFPLFGDAATAVVLEAVRPADDCFWYWEIDQLPAYADLIGSIFVPEARDEKQFPYPVARGLRRVTMRGKEVFSVAGHLAKDCIRLALKRTGLKPEDFGAVCLHQANGRITEAVARYLEFEDWQVIRNISRFGNTTSASVPLCLAEAWGQVLHNPDAHKLEPGDKILVVVFGAGFTVGVCILEWSEHCLEPHRVSWAPEAVEDLFRMAS